MNKIVFLFSAAALALASCSQEEVVNDVAQNNAIEFGTYVGRDAQTRGTVVDDNNLTFGVFAYYTEKNNWTTSSSANFMYNQLVTKKSTGCEYSPVKYWPNNTNDKVTFFAYAPYNASATQPTVDASGFKISHTVNNDVIAQTDLLYSTNFHKDLEKKTVNGTVDFTFAHALSRIGFSATCAVDEVPVGTNTLAEGTTITIDKIVLSAPDSDAGVFYTSGDLYTTATTNVTASWNNTTGTQAFTLTRTNDENNNLSTEVLDNNKASITDLNLANSYIMVIPQDFSSTGFDVEVTYTVTTDDANGTNNDSKIKNTIKNNVKLNLEKGKAYTLNLVLGMTSVKVSATVANWDVSTQKKDVDVPANIQN